MTEHYDAIVVGSGVVGASTAFHLAKLGRLKVCVVDQGPLCSGGTARSCAIVRSHYSVPSNTALTLRTLEIFAHFKDWLGDAEAATGFVQSGYLILAPDGPFAEKMRGNLAMQADVGAETHVITRREARERHHLLNLDDIAVVGYEPRSGYADPYLTTMSFLRGARARHAVVRARSPVRRLLVEAGKVKGVQTDQGRLHAGLVVLALGPWTPQVARPAGIKLALEVSRHVVITLRSDEPYASSLPVVKDLTAPNKMYFRPASGGDLLVGTGDHGDPVASPDSMDENVDDDFVLLQGEQIAHRMPAFGAAELALSWIGAYDITPDWNPVIGPVPGIAGLTLTYGFSGHGFKLAPALGESLAQTILGDTPIVDLAPYRGSRFAEGALLTGAYGVGSIS